MNFSEVLKDVTFFEEFNSKTFNYRINNFLYACNYTFQRNKHEIIMPIIDSKYQRGVIFNKGDFDEVKVIPFKKYDLDKHDYIELDGQSSDMKFIFNNYYGNRKINNRVLEIPFSINIIKNVDGINYQIVMKSLEKEEVKFFISSDTMERSLVFYANILDFSDILKITKSFVDDPKKLLNTYIYVRDEKRISFTNKDLEIGMNNDENFSKPKRKIKKR